jgi:hypothetical protein
MEHLHHGPKTVDLQFPCLSETTFDFAGEWLQYPDHEGIGLEKIRFLGWSKFSPAKLSKVLQNWLFFGLLRAVMPNDISIQMEDFIRFDEDGKRFISTIKLPEYLTKWTEWAGHLSLEERELVAQNNESVLDQARLLIYTLGRIPSKGRLSLHLYFPIPLDTALSCALLGEALALKNAALFARSPGMSWSSGDLFLEKMEMDGWCPFIVSGIDETFRLSTIHYFATLGGPNAKLNHGKCTEKICYHTLNNQARHSKQNCACSMLKPAIDEVVSVIRGNQTPILRHKNGPHADTLETGEASNSTAYVAISHVWSDGLGNPNGNQINLCQARRIQMAVDRLYQQEPDAHRDSSWWWLDTLCVPKGDAYKKEENLTISRMKEIYTKADKVLIIDSGLGACNESTEVFEILARFRLSNWIRRLWTIQEGLFATATYLLIGATPVSLSFLISKAKRLPHEGFQNQISHDLMSDYESIFGSSMPTDMDTTAIARFDGIATERRVDGVFQTVASRTSTFLRDEPVCLALLLDINPTPIIDEIEKEKKQEEEKQRGKEHEAHKSGSNNQALPPERGPSKAGMIKFIELAAEVSQYLDPPGCIPPHIIASRGKRLDKPGFQWAPESFLGLGKLVFAGSFNITNPDDSQSTIARPSGVPCENGLRVMFPGIIISEIHGDQPLHFNFLIDTSADPRRREYMPSFWKVTYSKSEYDPHWERTANSIGIAPTKDDSSKLAIIICHYGDLNWTGCCVLVRLKHTGPKGELIVSRLCTVSGGKTPDYDDQKWITEPWKRVRGTWLPVTQMWCVD